MPIKIRKWNVDKLSKEIKAENESVKQASKSNKGGTQLSMDDMIKGKGAEELKSDYKAPPRKNMRNQNTPLPNK